MQEVSVSEFKAKCLALLDQVQKTKEPLRITRRGKPIAEVVPPSQELNQGNWLGRMAGTVDILGDIVSPVIDIDDIEALRD